MKLGVEEEEEQGKSDLDRYLKNLEYVKYVNLAVKCVNIFVTQNNE